VRERDEDVGESERPKAEALGYLEAEALGYLEAWAWFGERMTTSRDRFARWAGMVDNRRGTL
jgi:hypothetical protein